MANIINANVLNVGAVNYFRRWNFDAVRTLIRRRRHYNERFVRDDHDPIWDRIAQQINQINNLAVTGNQCKSKWNSLKNGYENLKRIVAGNPDGYPVHSPNSYDREFHGELTDEFWITSGKNIFY